MIATHNIKVNGRWYRAGEEVPEQAETSKKEEKPVEKTEAPKAEKPAEKEEPKVESKPRSASTSTRRKKISE